MYSGPGGDIEHCRASVAAAAAVCCHSNDITLRHCVYSLVSAHHTTPHGDNATLIFIANVDRVGRHG